MTLKYIKFSTLILLFFSCHQTKTNKEANYLRISIDNSLKPNPSIEDFLQPYKKHLDASMAEILCYSENACTKTEDALNTALGNMMADAVFEMTAPILKKRQNETLDLVLLNHGGIRAALPKGPIKTENAFRIMPFENQVVVVQMKGPAILEMIDYLKIARRAHPISGMTLHITKKGILKKLLIQGKPLNLNNVYNVATSDYLLNGGDRMDFFKKNNAIYDIDYKIRNILIDYFKAKDTLNPKRDMRFIYTE